MAGYDILKYDKNEIIITSSLRVHFEIRSYFSSKFSSAAIRDVHHLFTISALGMQL